MPTTSPTKAAGRALDLLIQQARQQRAHHRARKGEQAARADQVADERGDKGRAQAVPWAEQHARDDIDHVLHRRALGRTNRDGKHAANHRDCGQQTGQGQFPCTID